MLVCQKKDSCKVSFQNGEKNKFAKMRPHIKLICRKADKYKVSLLK